MYLESYLKTLYIQPGNIAIEFTMCGISSLIYYCVTTVTTVLEAAIDQAD